MINEPKLTPGLDDDARAQIAEILATVAEEGLPESRDIDAALDAIEAIILAIPRGDASIPRGPAGAEGDDNSGVADAGGDEQ